MGESKFKRVFFGTSYCDVIPHVRTPAKGAYVLSLSHTVDAAFPALDRTQRAVIMYEFLRDRDNKRLAASVKRTETIAKRGNG